MMSYNGASVETESQTSIPHISISIAVYHIQHQLSDTSDSQPRATDHMNPYDEAVRRKHLHASDESVPQDMLPSR
jgi:hypothetical protein